MIKVVLFDLDDTLISEEEYIKSGYKHVSKIIANKYQLDELSVYGEMYSLYIESPSNIFNRLLDNYQIGYEKKDIMYLVDEYRNHIPDIKFYDDVIPTINELKNLGIKIGVISDGYLVTQKNKSKVLHLEEIFDKVIFTDELGKKYWKPHPYAFELMKEYFNTNYDEMIYIGDNPKKDFYISNIYGMRTVRIYRNNAVYCDTPYYMEIKETFTIYRLDELLGGVK